MTTEPTATMTTLIARIEADARDLLALAPQSRHAQAILDAAKGLRRANRRPLPEGWKWTASGYLRAESGGYIACTFADGYWAIFDGLDDAADEVCHGREVDEDTACAAVEEYLWQHGWPS